MPSESITRPPTGRLRVIVTGGGTGGHISPILAVVEELRATRAVDLHWIGSHSGPERTAAQRLGIPYSAVHTGKLRRYASLSTLVDCVRVPAGTLEAGVLVRRIHPDVVFSSGGFVGVPVVIAARALGVPSITHEQTAHLGLATRINSRFSEVIALSFPRAEQQQRMGRANVALTGNPVRRVVLGGDPARARALFGFAGQRPLVYVTGGMQGAHAINTAIAEALPQLLHRADVLHQCGPSAANGDFERLCRLQESLNRSSGCRYVVVESVGDEIGDVFAAADLVIGRAGAGTVAELAAVGVPSMLIPLPGAEEQRRNALALANVGAAILLPQPEATAERIADQIEELLDDPERLQAMRAAGKSQAMPDAAARLVSIIVELSE